MAFWVEVCWLGFAWISSDQKCHLSPNAQSATTSRPKLNLCCKTSICVTLRHELTTHNADLGIQSDTYLAT